MDTYIFTLHLDLFDRNICEFNNKRPKRYEMRSKNNRLICLLGERIKM